MSPSPLAFGNWATGTNSNARSLTVTNTGNAPLAGGSFTFGGGTPQPFTRATNGQGGGGSCGATLAVGASCTYNVVFTPAAAVAYSRTLTVAYTGATVTGSPVTLTGTGVASRAAVSISPNPLTISLASGTITGTGTVTLTNTSNTTTGASFTVSSVAVNGAGASIAAGIWFFNRVNGADNCTGTTLAPGASCTVGASFTEFLGTTRPQTQHGTITFNDNAAGAPQTGGLTGISN